VPGHVLAIGGLSPDHDDTALHRFVIELSGVRRPRVCFVPTASGDHDGFIEKFYELYPTSICEPSHLTLVRSVPSDPVEMILDQDVIYVGGGSTPILLAALRVHGLDHALRARWEAGALLCGDSAGSLVWFTGGVTDALGPELRPMADGLRFLPGSNCPHFDHPGRQEAFEAAIRAGDLDAGTAADDGAALLREGTTLVEAVSSRPTGSGHRVTREGADVDCTPIPTRRL